MVPTGQVAEKQAYEEPRQDHELKSWRCLVFYLCFFGFMAQLRPGESFITPFLLERKFTKEQVTNEIIPMLPYSHLAVLVPVFLLTDYLRYKPVLVLQCLSFVCVWLLLLVRMLSELVENARQPQLRLWCLWWVFNSSGYYLITYYVHVLWRSTDSSLSYNGAVDAASTLLSMHRRALAGPSWTPVGL